MTEMSSSARDGPKVRAAVLHRTGGPGVLEFGEVSLPALAESELRVRVRATSVNRLDAWIRSGTYPVPLPHVLGTDIAGEVEVAGEAVASEWPVGTRVVAFPTLSCGTCVACRLGRESLCPRVGILGRECWGGYAESVQLPARQCWRIPSSTPWESAAAFPLTYLTAEHMLGRATSRAGETALVVGATGGVGQALLDRGRRRGLRVLALTSQPERAQDLRAKGAAEVLLRGREDVVGRARELTRGEGVDIVLDSSGPQGVQLGLGALRRGGRLVTCGATSGAQLSLGARDVYGPQISILGSFLGDSDEFRQLILDLGRGALHPVVDAVFPLAEAANAHRALEREHFGKIVLRT